MNDEAYESDLVSDAELGGVEDTEEEAPPSGTLFFMMILLFLMVGLWVTVYWMLLSR